MQEPKLKDLSSIGEHFSFNLNKYRLKNNRRGNMYLEGLHLRVSFFNMKESNDSFEEIPTIISYSLKMPEAMLTFRKCK